VRRAAAFAIVLALGGCERAAHNMYEGARDRPLAPSARFDDGSARNPVAGSVERSRGVLAETSSGRTGADAEAERVRLDAATSMPLPSTLELMRRGRERFEIFCSPCHGVLGDGDGIVARRGFPHPPSYHEARLRAAPDRHFYEVISNGYGLMYAYGDRIEPRDRWAIVAYIRALQLSQDAPR